MSLQVDLTPDGLQIRKPGGERLLVATATECEALVRRLLQARRAMWSDVPPATDIVVFEPIPDYGDLMPIKEFMKAVASGAFIDYDGDGQYATVDAVSNFRVTPSQAKKTAAPPWATHVVWYNR